jgi:FKBP-type peptidyl-prolyl cis-trans isomerase
MVVRWRANPIRLKPSQQAGRELHRQARQRESEAGGNESAGRAIESRNMYSCGNNFPEAGRKADVIDEAEGSSPKHDKASERDATGVLEQGTHLKGQLGNLREPTVSWE